MLYFLFRRVARILIILVSVELFVFLLVHSVPGNPWDTPNNQLGSVTNFAITDTTMAHLNKYYGLDLPLWRQFTRYMIGDYHEEGSLFVV